MAIKGQNVHDWSGHLHSNWFTHSSRDAQIRTSLFPLDHFHSTFTYLRRFIIHFFSFRPMDYYKDLKREDFASDDDYFLERFNRGLTAGFTFQQYRYHQLIDFALALGLSKADIFEIAGPDTGYIFLTHAPPSNIDMIGAQDGEEISLSIGRGHVL